MKKYYLLLVVLMGFGSVSGQIINFPDANFKAMLLSADTWNSTAKNLNGENFKIDSNNDGEIDVAEALQVKNLDINDAIPAVSNISGINYFVSLESLDIAFNLLTGELDVSSLVNLEVLKCYDNYLTSLNLPISNSLVILQCFGNNLLNINTENLIHLKNLQCNGNQLTNLNLEPLIALESLDCLNNPISNLDVSSLNTLIFLKIGYCPITTINLEGLSSIVEIVVHSTDMTTLDVSGLSTLKKLNIDDNTIINLDVTGCIALENLICSNNEITSLNLQGMHNLKTLNCSSNQLTILDLRDNYQLNSTTIYSNPLQTLLLKNGKSQNIISQLAALPTLEYICADFLESIGLVNEVTQLNLNCEVNSYCSFTPGGIFYNINGIYKFDSNNNGCDGIDATISNKKFKITDGSQIGSFTTNETGQFSVPLEVGTHTVTTVFENPTYFNVYPTSATVSFPTTTSPFIQNFCITPNGIHPDLEVAIVPTTPARPGFDADYKIVIKNKGNIQQSGSVNFTYNDAVLDYVSANPLATTQETGTMTWDFANLQPFETREILLTLNVNSPMETPAVNADDILNYTATITSAATDDMPLDNTFSLPQTVVNSFDPNDKTCLEGTEITPDMIGKYVHYMIRFENTGTFPAENIVVKDMIDATKFDVASLIPLNASHDYVTRIAGNKVEFIFENINLPFEDAMNDGYIVFKIKTKPTLVLGDSFSNSASIYFDYNFPIVTDPAVTTFAILSSEDFVFNNYLTLYPNPAKNILNINLKQSIELKSMEVYNILGQLVLSIPNANGVDKVDVSNLNAGTYFLKVSSDKGTSNTKFIKN